MTQLQAAAVESHRWLCSTRNNVALADICNTNPLSTPRAEAARAATARRRRQPAPPASHRRQCTVMTRNSRRAAPISGPRHVQPSDESACNRHTSLHDCNGRLQAVHRHHVQQPPSSTHLRASPCPAPPMTRFANSSYDSLQCCLQCSAMMRISHQPSPALGPVTSKRLTVYKTQFPHGCRRVQDTGCHSASSVTCVL